jgi:hypothetical protein
MNDFFRADYKAEAERIKNLNKDIDSNTKGIFLLLGILLGFAIAIPVMVYFIWASSFVGVQLWTWFIMPIFAVPALTKLQMAGIFTLVALVKMGLATTPIDKNKLATFIGLSIAPWMVLLTGYVIHRLM